MITATADIIDALNSLLEAEMNSIFRFMDEDFPYLNRAVADVRKTVSEMAQLSRRHAQELANLIDSFGGVPTPRQQVRSEGQYLAYLSLKFLLPKLVNEKTLLLERYENARKFIGSQNPKAAAVLDSIIAEQHQLLARLQKAAEHELPPTVRPNNSQNN
jgi:bacterioferritin (cytochrome b1)